MNLAAIGDVMRRDFADLTGKGLLNAVEVKVHYEAAMSEADAAKDPWMEEEAAAPGAAKVLPVMAMVHFVTEESATQKGWTEITGGDVIVDFPHDFDPAAYRNPRYEINGSTYVPKTTQRGLTEAWDVIAGGTPVVRTLLLERSN